MRYHEVFGERFDKRYGILSYRVRFYPDDPERGFDVEIGLVRWKRVARMKRFQDLPGCKPVAVFDIVKVDKRGKAVFDKHFFGKIVVPHDKYWITIERTREYYRVNDVFIVVSYLVRRHLQKDYLLLINGCKVAIPKPRFFKSLKISYEYDDQWLRRMLEGSKKLEKILNGEKELEYWEESYPKLVYIDPDLQKQLEDQSNSKVLDKVLD